MFTGNSDADSAAVIAADLPTRWLGHTHYAFAEIDSTNAWLSARTEQLSHGTIAVADYQSAGRGRLNRQWSAPPRTGLLLSILLKPDWPSTRTSWLTMITGLAAQSALQAAAPVPVKLKWPNDIVAMDANEQMVKLGGILVEASLTEGELHTAVVGMGLNVNLDEADLPDLTHTPASSLAILAHKRLDRRPILQRLLHTFEDLYAAADQGISPHRAWAQQLITLNRPVTISTSNGVNSWQGVAVDVDEWGQLLVQQINGSIVPVSAADVTLRPLKT